MNLHGPSNCVDRRDTFITHQKKKFRQSFKPEEPAGYIVNEEDLTSTLFRFDWLIQQNSSLIFVLEVLEYIFKVFWRNILIFI